MKTVIIEVFGGVASPVQLPEGVTVVINDYDNATDEADHSTDTYTGLLDLVETN